MVFRWGLVPFSADHLIRKGVWYTGVDLHVACPHEQTSFTVKCNCPWMVSLLVKVGCHGSHHCGNVLRGRSISFARFRFLSTGVPGTRPILG
jgi:hypothetical protein